MQLKGRVWCMWQHGWAPRSLCRIEAELVSAPPHTSCLKQSGSHGGFRGWGRSRSQCSMRQSFIGKKKNLKIDGTDGCPTVWETTQRHRLYRMGMAVLYGLHFQSARLKKKLKQLIFPFFLIYQEMLKIVWLWMSFRFHTCLALSDILDSKNSSFMPL